MPDEVADPAQDPNNQGEDEFEEAELDGKADQFGHTKRPTQHMVKEKVWKVRKSLMSFDGQSSFCCSASGVAVIKHQGSLWLQRKCPGSVAVQHVMLQAEDSGACPGQGS